MPRFKLALTYEEKVGAFQLQRRPINRLDHRDAFNGLIQVQFQSQMRSTPMLQAEFSANAEKAARTRTKASVIEGELQLALSVQPFKPGT